jgi:hypothetical protein
MKRLKLMSTIVNPLKKRKKRGCRVLIGYPRD